MRRPKRKAANRLDTCFARLKARGAKAFVSYTVACDPSFEESLERLFTYARAGVDAIEIGFPFSDPILDGDSIRAANRRALAAGGNLARALELCAAFRRRDATTPLILMGYAAALVAMGYDAFAERAAAAGVDGVIVADMPLREADALLAALAPLPVVMIPLAAPNLPAVDSIARRPGLGGFLYCIPVIGATGGPSASRDEVAQAVARGRAATDLPLLVGFGVKTPAMAAQIARLADGVIVATALLDQIRALPPGVSSADREQRVGELVKAYRQAIDAATLT
jgi:tryptophan synthase alpha chain